MLSSDLIQKAIRTAEEAHRGQYRRYSGVPYILHPARVAELVSEVTDDEEVIAAAWLHDVLEDCPDTSLEGFPDHVVGLVKALTKKGTGNWWQNNRLKMACVWWAGRDAQLICAADGLANMEDLIKANITVSKAVMKKFRYQGLVCFNLGNPYLDLQSKYQCTWKRMKADNLDRSHALLSAEAEFNHNYESVKNPLNPAKFLANN